MVYIYGPFYHKYRHLRPQMQPHTCCPSNVSVEEYNEDSECKGPWWLPLSSYTLDSCKVCWATPITLFIIAIITNLHIFYVSTKSFGLTVGLNVILNYIVKYNQSASLLTSKLKSMPKELGACSTIEK